MALKQPRLIPLETRNPGIFARCYHDDGSPFKDVSFIMMHFHCSISLLLFTIWSYTDIISKWEPESSRIVKESVIQVFQLWKTIPETMLRTFAQFSREIISYANDVAYWNKSWDKFAIDISRLSFLANTISLFYIENPSGLSIVLLARWENETRLFANISDCIIWRQDCGYRWAVSTITSLNDSECTVP